MKKLVCLALAIGLCLSFYGCKKDEPFISDPTLNSQTDDSGIVWAIEPTKEYEDVMALEYYYSTNTPRANYLSFKQGGKWGVMNEKLEVIVEAESDTPATMCSLGHIHVSIFGDFQEYVLFDGIAVVNGGHGVVTVEIVYNVEDSQMYVATSDESGMDVVRISEYAYELDNISVFKHVRLFYDEFALSYGYEDLSLYGYCNSEGRILTDIRYEYATIFSSGIAAVMKDNRWAYIDTAFNAVTGYIYQPCYGHADYNGQCLDPFFTYSFVSGYGVCMSNTKYGVIDKTGAVVVPFEYEKIVPMPGGRALIKIDQKWGVADLGAM